MGQLKQQLIADQVEEADRPAPPLPASVHAAVTMPTRRDRRIRQEQIRRRDTDILVSMSLSFLLGAVTILAVWGLLEVFA